MGFASWQRYCTALQYWASAKLCGVEQRAPPIFGRAAITLGIGSHSSSFFFYGPHNHSAHNKLHVDEELFVFGSKVSVSWSIGKNLRICKVTLVPGGILLRGNSSDSTFQKLIHCKSFKSWHLDVGIYIYLLPSPRRFMFSMMFVCLLATLHKNFGTDLHEIFYGRLAVGH